MEYRRGGSDGITGIVQFREPTLQGRIHHSARDARRSRVVGDSVSSCESRRVFVALSYSAAFDRRDGRGVYGWSGCLAGDTRRVCYLLKCLVLMCLGVSLEQKIYTPVGYVYAMIGMGWDGLGWVECARDQRKTLHVMFTRHVVDEDGSNISTLR